MKNAPGLKRKTFDSLLNLLEKAGVYSALRTINKNNLTVLNYHRINFPGSPEFNTFKPNISATPDQFDRQMTYLKSRFNMVSARQISAWVQGDAVLPQQAAIITFDDGYADNLTHAFPILQAHGFSALIFLTTDFIGKSLPAYWDTAADCFARTRQNSAVLPLMGEAHWHNDREKEAVLLRWIERVKTLPDEEKNALTRQIPETLGVNPADANFSNLFLTWEQVREMTKNGIEFGSHTVSHPILTRIPLERVRVELTESRKAIEKETGSSVDSFAYPNGGAADFNADIVKLTEEAGYRLAFTLIPGPNPYAKIQREPFTIRRIFLSHTDSFARFAAKVHGLRRFF